jgi:hemerythrin
MEWRPEYCVGIEEIDNQHRTLVSHFTRVEEAINEDKGWSDLHFALHALAEYAKYHFHFEESLMRLFGFDGVEQHALQHKFYADKLSKKLTKTLNSDIEHEVLQMLGDWVINHINGSDVEYVQHIKSGASVVFSNRNA